VEQLAQKSRTFAALIRTIKQCLTADGLRSSIPDYVATFNALALPKCYMYVDPNDLVHVVFIDNRQRSLEGDERAALPLPKLGLGMQVEVSADVIWNFQPQTGMWRVTKDRTGDFQSLCPIKCGGMPEVKRNV
jgi:hypothetical protein